MAERLLRLSVALAVGLLAGSIAAAAQGAVHYPTPAQPAGTPRLEFDVISVKPSAPDEQGGMVRPMPADQGYVCDGAPLFTDMTVAYGVTGRQIEGGPDWIRTERWDIEAISSGPRPVDELHLMLEHALEDRFALRLHHETRQQDVLSLEADAHGAKLKSHEPANDPNTAPMGIGPGSQPGTLVLSGTNISMSYLAFFLSRA